MLTRTQVLPNVIIRRTRQTDRMPQRMVLVHDEDIAKEVSYVIKYEYVASHGLHQSYMFSHNYFAPALFLRIYFSWLDDCKHDTSSARVFFAYCEHLNFSFKCRSDLCTCTTSDVLAIIQLCPDMKSIGLGWDWLCESCLLLREASSRNH